MSMRCLIVDDEPIARSILEAYCAKMPELELVGSCENAMKALEVLRTKSVDILFLDINMPIMSGLELMSTLKHQPQVILTTAYSEYAVQAFELNVCDYLLKPFSFDRFVKAVNKAIDSTIDATETDFMVLRSGAKLHRLALKGISYLEAKGNYTNVVSEQHSDEIYIPISKMEELLNPNDFIRVHRSFIVAKDKVTAVEPTRILLGKNEVPIGRKFQESTKVFFGINKD
jgi:DNA-binding LytR/AlgR family response regulator